MVKSANTSKGRHVSKRCPYCAVYLPLETVQCTSCKKKIGEVNEHGTAKKPVNWFGYFTAILACGGFLGFIYWLFFLKG